MNVDFKKSNDHIYVPINIYIYNINISLTYDYILCDIKKVQ